MRIADSSWFVPYYGDIGGGGGTTTTTWQAMAGVGKAFSWGDIALVYRALYYDMHNGGLTQKTTMAGWIDAGSMNHHAFRILSIWLKWVLVLYA